MPDVRLKRHSSDDQRGRVCPRRQGCADPKLARRGGVLRLRLRRLLLLNAPAGPVNRFNPTWSAPVSDPSSKRSFTIQARRLGLLHDDVKKYGTVCNTVAPGIESNQTPRPL